MPVDIVKETIEQGARAIRAVGQLAVSWTQRREGEKDMKGEAEVSQGMMKAESAKSHPCQVVFALLAMSTKSNRMSATGANSR